MKSPCPALPCYPCAPLPPARLFHSRPPNPPRPSRRITIPAASPPVAPLEPCSRSSGESNPSQHRRTVQPSWREKPQPFMTIRPGLANSPVTQPSIQLHIPIAPQTLSPILLLPTATRSVAHRGRNKPETSPRPASRSLRNKNCPDTPAPGHHSRASAPGAAWNRARNEQGSPSRTPRSRHPPSRAKAVLRSLQIIWRAVA